MGNPSTGHIGFCLSGNNGGKFETFEFNTSADSSAVVRDGEGAYYRNRPFKDVGDMHILGFIDLQKAMSLNEEFFISSSFDDFEFSEQRKMFAALVL